MEQKIYDTPQAVAEAFTTDFVSLVNQNESLSVALSGGSTPKILLDLLAEKHADLDWSRVHFYWGDEPCVPPTDGDSNYKMTVDHLLSKIDMPEANVHRVKGENDPAAEAVDYGKQIEQNLPSVNELAQFDLVILGMGGDGHTASIFPHEIELLEAPSTCAVATHPESGQIRVSLTGNVINNAKRVAFLVTGAGKAEKIDEIFNQKGDWQRYPAAHIKPVSGKLSWYMDQAAAAAL